ncbi:MAG: MerR family transcriptional regulator [Paludibacteraceae bacterium]|nr:MerR family transcriptional regulator [Paludibacteraceae bacterium]
MEEVKKVYYSMKEVSADTGLPASTLRFWEKQFTDLSPRKDAHGNRYYSEQDISLLKRIQYIRDELKITRIEAIKAALESRVDDKDYRPRVYEILQRVRQTLVDIRANL